MLLIYSVGFTSLLNCSFYAIAVGTDLGAFAAIDPDKENEITEKYISDTDSQEALIQMRHVNRNVNKGVEYNDDTNN